MSPSSGRSVLENMAAGLMSDKRTAAAGLTPLPGEAPPAPLAPQPAGAIPATIPTAMFPNDQPAEAIIASVRNIRRELKAIEAALAAIDDYLAQPEPAAPAVDEQKEAERAADAKHAEFAANFERLKAEAQASAYGTPEVDEPISVTDWACPDHHKLGIVKTSPKGREFIGCPDCSQFRR